MTFYPIMFAELRVVWADDYASGDAIRMGMRLVEDSLHGMYIRTYIPTVFKYCCTSVDMWVLWYEYKHIPTYNALHFYSFVNTVDNLPSSKSISKSRKKKKYFQELNFSSFRVTILICFYLWIRFFRRFFVRGFSM